MAIEYRLVGDPALMAKFLNGWFAAFFVNDGKCGPLGNIGSYSKRGSYKKSKKFRETRRSIPLWSKYFVFFHCLVLAQ